MEKSRLEVSSLSTFLLYEQGCEASSLLKKVLNNIKTFFENLNPS